MGNKYSRSPDVSNSQDIASLHVTFFLPVFGTLSHTGSFILSSSVPYPDDPLFGAFILSPWFEQLANKMSNEQFYEKYRATPRYQDNYEPSTHFSWDRQLQVYKPIDTPVLTSFSNGVIELKRNPIPPGREPDEPEGLHYRPKRLDLDTSQYPIIQADVNTEANQQQSQPQPTHVPFFKIGLPTQPFTAYPSANDNTAKLWLDGIYPFQYLPGFHSDKGQVLPFKGLGVRSDFSKFDYSFVKDKKKPYTGLGGDGIKTEYDIFSQYKYPRKSLIAVQPSEGYNIGTLICKPHVDTIPTHHLGTVLILDMISNDTITVLSQFLTQTLSLLQRGCILPLTNVDLWILQLNADKLDNSIMGNDLIIEKVTEIGFDLNHIHFCPYEISPNHNYLPSSQLHYGLYPFYPPLRACPLLSKPNLTHFLSPIWDTVYLKTFQLHQEGHWDRLAERSARNQNIKFIPPHIFPIQQYQRLRHPEERDTDSIFSPQLAQKQFLDAIKGYNPYYHHTDHLAIALTLNTAAMHRTFQIKAQEYFGPTLSSAQEQRNNTNPVQSRGQSSSDLQPAYELLFQGKEPSWDDPRTYFPHIKTLKQFITNPKPLPLHPDFDFTNQNNGRRLPLLYKPDYLNEPRSVSDFEPESDENHDDRDKTRTFYPKFYAASSIWPVQSTTRTDINNFTNYNLQTTPSQKLLHQNLSLSDQILSLGLPKRYEFESFILWMNRAIIADQYNLVESEYFYEPHVQDEIMKAVDRIKLESLQNDIECAQNDANRDQSSFVNTAPSTSQTSTAITTQPIISSTSSSTPPTTILKTLLPSLIHSKPNLPTPMDYLMLTLPSQFSRNLLRGKIDFGSTLYSFSLSLDKRISDQVLSRSVSRLVGHLHLLPQDGFSPYLTYSASTPTSEKHITPPILRHKHYTAVVPLTYAHTRVEFEFSGRADDGNSTKNYSVDDPDTGKDKQPFLRTTGQSSELVSVESALSGPNLAEQCSSDPIVPIASDKSPQTPKPTTDASPIPIHSHQSTSRSQNSPTPKIEIGLTYLHRCTVSSTVDNHQHGRKYCFYASHPLFEIAPLLPMAWLHGILIIPFVYIASRTKLIKSKLGYSESPSFLNRPVGECPYPTIASGNEFQQKGGDVSKSQEDQNLPSNNTTFRSYPPGFIPPPIPSIWPSNQQNIQRNVGNWLEQHLYAKEVMQKYQSSPKSGMESEHILPSTISPTQQHLYPFTIPLSQLKCKNLDNLLPYRSVYSILDPCGQYKYPAGLSSYHSPMTFIVLIPNPIHPDPIPYSNIVIPHQVMGCEDLTPIKMPNDDQDPTPLFFKDVPDDTEDTIPFSDSELNGNELDECGGRDAEEMGNNHQNTQKTSQSSLGVSNTQTNLPSLIEPITQSQFRYYQEYIPSLYKRQLTEQIFGHGLAGSTPAKLQKLWTVEVHTPQTLKAAIKRIETDAVETRMKLYRDLVLSLEQEQHERMINH